MIGDVITCRQPSSQPTAQKFALPAKTVTFPEIRSDQRVSVPLVHFISDSFVEKAPPTPIVSLAARSTVFASRQTGIESSLSLLFCTWIERAEQEVKEPGTTDPECSILSLPSLPALVGAF
jgi:hypothetical protein